MNSLSVQEIYIGCVEDFVDPDGAFFDGRDVIGEGGGGVCIGGVGAGIGCGANAGVVNLDIVAEHGPGGQRGDFGGGDVGAVARVLHRCWTPWASGDAVEARD